MQQKIKRFFLVCLLVNLIGIQATVARQSPRDTEATNQVQDGTRINLAIRDFSSSYSSAKWDSSTDAQQAVSRGEQLELAVQQYFLIEERVCSERFFVNSCVDHLRLQRRTWQDQIRLVTQAAKAYIRQSKSKR